ncbi:glycosyltransferase family 4 protein [Cupriavidus pauculus]|uniref:glycosyltransferase family 4 protein n=1 Tax=Cupriavidus pauculus TaxID=82633 RepID=UPI001D0CB20F|nr:glycosyltransferase family 4 protein [Cupriavidus pauculus]
MTATRHICFLTGTLNAMAGAERMTAVMANALAERGFAVSILSLWDAASCFALRGDVDHVALFTQRPSFKRAYLATVAGIRRHCKLQAVDVLVQVDPMLSLFALPATIGLSVEHIAWEHCHFDEDLGRRSRRFARRLAGRYCAHVIVLTDRDRQRWNAALRPRADVLTLPNPLPFPIPDNPSPGTSRTVMAMGRLVHAKGFDVLLRAWQLAAPRMWGWQLRIFGEGDEREELLALTRQLGIADTVEFPGVCADPAHTFAQASMFCLSSRYEGFGLVLIEAMAYGLPIVSTNCETGPRALLRNGENGLLVAVDDPAALADGLERLAGDASLRTSLATNARIHVRQFSIETVAEKWQSILTALSAPRDSHAAMGPKSS